MKVGFVGLGIMGSRMAARLQAAGYDLVVSNRTRAKAESLLAAGAQWADRPSGVGRQADVLFTMLADPNCGAGRGRRRGRIPCPAQAGARSGSTAARRTPSFARAMAEQAAAFDIHFVDAPVMGSKDPAANGQLTFLVGGDAADLGACRAYFAAMGKEVKHLGPVGAGISFKLVNNYLLRPGNPRLLRGARVWRVAWD